MITKHVFLKLVCSVFVVGIGNLCLADEFVKVKGQEKVSADSSSSTEWVVPRSSSAPLSSDSENNAPADHYKISPSSESPKSEQATTVASVDHHSESNLSPASIPPVASPVIPESQPSVKADLPIVTARAQIQHVDNQQQFVVLEFKNTDTIPGVGSTLSVYRANRMIGNIKITDPIQPPYASADILNGTIQLGDIIH
jgi:hypothetical protein